MSSAAAPAAPRRRVERALALALAAFVLAEVNYPHLRPASRLALFAWLGLTFCFLACPPPRRRPGRAGRAVDLLLCGATAFCCGYVFVESEPFFRGLWASGQSLGDRAGAETPFDLLVASVGVVVVLVATRRAVGLALPLLAGAFLLYAWQGDALPAGLFPHRGYPLGRIVAQAFLHGQGVFGIALSVMFTYVYLFVLFGALLEATGATGFVLDGARRLFRGSPGAPAKVAVLASGIMGSLSGSAVANTATTGTFTIPLMRGAGFAPHIAAGIEAAASSGGALVPPVMGAAAYMMLEIVQPPVSYLRIIRAAFLPAVLYYASLFLLVHFSARRLGVAATDEEPSAAAGADEPGRTRYPAVLFFGALAALLAFLLYGVSVFRAASLAMGVVLVLAAAHPSTRLGPRRLVDAAHAAARGAVALVAASAAVGIVLGVVVLTGLGSRLAGLLLPMAEQNLLGALAALMVASLVLGMGLPSAVCYLLLATLVGPSLGRLGVEPLAAHFFIFYFGMMSMVTPPVALAAYTAASIAGADILRSSWAAFRFALVGFTLPYLFVVRPELLLLGPGGGPPPWTAVAYAVAVALAGIAALAGGLAGFVRKPLGPARRVALFAAAGLLLYPGGSDAARLAVDGAGALLAAGAILFPERS